MDYEIDFIPVGEESKCGDAIAVRFIWKDSVGQNKQYVMVIDGGTKESAAALVEHIKKYYLTDTVDLAVSSHPDADHASGLAVVLEELKVRHLYMHRPWAHSADIDHLFTDGRITSTSIKEKAKKALEDAHDLEAIAKRKNIPIIEPFSDEANINQGIIVLGPSKAFYESLLPSFRCFEGMAQATSLTEYLGKPFLAAKEVLSFIAESLHIETLSDPTDSVSAENNSSAIILINVANSMALLTGDAGVDALSEAANKADALGIDLKKISFIQIPHHGSRRNLGPSILNRIVGPRLAQYQKQKTAFVSCAKKSEPKHPSKKVTNAFTRRGVEVHATMGLAKQHFTAGMPGRGWVASTPLPFYNSVEE